MSVSDIVNDYIIINDDGEDNLSLIYDRDVTIDDKKWNTPLQYLYNSVLLNDSERIENHRELYGVLNRQITEKCGEYLYNAYSERFKDKRIQKIASDFYKKEGEEEIILERSLALEDVDKMEEKPLYYQGFTRGLRVSVKDSGSPHKIQHLIRMRGEIGVIVDFIRKRKLDNIDRMMNIKKIIPYQYYVVVKFDKKIPGTDRDYEVYDWRNLILKEEKVYPVFKIGETVKIISLGSIKGKVVKIDRDFYDNFIKQVMVRYINPYTGKAVNQYFLPHLLNKINLISYDSLGLTDIQLKNIFRNQPINLEKGKFNYLSTKINNDYMYRFTLKVDGVRSLCVCYIGGDNRLYSYFINRSFTQVPYMQGFEIKSKTPITLLTVFDGELTEIKGKKYYFIFDILFDRGISKDDKENLLYQPYYVRESVLLQKQILLDTLSQGGIKFLAKYPIPIQQLTIYNYQQIVDNYNLGFGLDIPHDGIIFVNYYGDFYQKSYKWKPVEQITVDFRIVDSDDPEKFYLLCMGTDKRFNILEEKDYCPNGENVFRAYSKGSPYRVNKREFNKFAPYKVGDIFEFVFDRKKYVPIRRRGDKDKPNFYKTILSTIRSMKNPVHFSDIQDLIIDSEIPLQEKVNEVEIRFGSLKDGVYIPNISKQEYTNYIRNAMFNDKEIEEKTLLFKTSDKQSYEAKLTKDNKLVDMNKFSKKQHELIFFQPDIKITYNQEEYSESDWVDYDSMYFVRYKDRISKFSDRFPNWRFDFTKTIQKDLSRNPQLLENFLEDQLPSIIHQHEYEFEIEWIGDGLPRSDDIDKVIESVKSSEEYFKDVAVQDKKIMKKILNFHSYVKSGLYDSFVGEGSTLLELGGGRFNDLHKWIRLGLDTVVVVDNNEKALEIGMKRYDTERGKGKEVPRVIPIHANFSADDIKEKLKEARIDIDYFDNIMCNFAIHYATENDESFEIFAHNVDELLKSDGNFIYTTMDGESVFKILKNSGINETIELLNENGEWIVKITKLYDDESFAPYNNPIKVVVRSIGSENVENLVDIKYINDYFEDELGYVIKYDRSFEQDYIEDFNLSEEEKDFSFLNTFVVLQKRKFPIQDIEGTQIYINDEVRIMKGNNEEMVGKIININYGDYEGDEKIFVRLIATYEVLEIPSRELLFIDSIPPPPPPPPLPEDEEVKLEEYVEDEEVKLEEYIEDEDEDYDHITEILPTLLEDYDYNYSYENHSLEDKKYLPKDEDYKYRMEYESMGDYDDDDEPFDERGDDYEEDYPQHEEKKPSPKDYGTQVSTITKVEPRQIRHNIPSKIINFQYRDVNEVLNEDTVVNPLVRNIKYIFNNALDLDMNDDEKYELLTNITNAYRCLMHKIDRLDDIIDYDGMSYEDIIKTCDDTIQLNKFTVKHDFDRNILLGMNIIEGELTYPGSMVNNIRKSYLKPMRKRLKVYKRSILMKAFIERIYRTQYIKKLNEEQKDYVEGLSKERRYNFLSSKILREIEKSSKIGKKQNEDIIAIEVKLTEYKKKKERLLKKSNKLADLVATFGPMEGWRKDVEIRAIDEKLKLTKTLYLLAGKIDKRNKELKEVKKEHGIKDYTDAYKHMAKQIKEFYKLNMLKDLDLYFTPEEKTILLKPVPDKKEIEYLEKNFRVPNWEELSNYRNTGEDGLYSTFRCLLPSYKLNITIDGKNYKSIENYVFSQVIENLFVQKELANLTSSSNFSLYNYVDAKNSYILNKIYESLQIVGDKINIRQRISESFDKTDNRPILYNEDTLLGVSISDFSKYDNKNLYGSYLMEVRDSERNIEGGFVISAFNYFPNKTLNEFLVNRGRFLINLIHQLYSVFKVKEGISVIDVINDLSKNCGKHQSNTRFPLPQQFYEKVRDIYKCESSECSEQERQVIIIVWNYLISLIFNIPKNTESIASVQMSLNTFFETHLNRSKHFDINDIRIALRNIKYFVGKNFRPIIEFPIIENKRNEFDEGFEKLIKGIFDITGNVSHYSELEAIILSKIEDDKTRNKILFFS